jgi:selenocysteine lyase/cysteine desulfurase
VIGADLEETALTHNTTEGLNIVAQGLPLKSGDQVIITDQEHPGHFEAWRLRSKRDNIDVVRVKIPSPLPDAATFVNLIDAAITSRTKLIAVPHITTTTGLITPARQICALARSKNILCLLDGAHGSGQIKFNVKDLGCDFYATSPHKWLHAPLGNGIFYVRRELQDKLWPLTGAAGWDTYPDARKYSAFGNRSWATAMALGDAIDFANAIGIEKIEARHRELMTYFKQKFLSLPGVEPLTPNDPAMYCAQSAFRIPKLNAHALCDTLREKHGIVVGEKADGFRADIGYYITKPQLDHTLAIFERLIKKGNS